MRPGGLRGPRHEPDKEDIGAKPLQIIGTALPFVSEARIILWLAFLALVCLPVGVLMACRSLRLPAAALNGALVSLLFLFWTNPNLALAFRWGMISLLRRRVSSPHGSSRLCTGTSTGRTECAPGRSSSPLRRCSRFICSGPL